MADYIATHPYPLCDIARPIHSALSKRVANEFLLRAGGVAQISNTHRGTRGAAENHFTRTVEAGDLASVIVELHLVRAQIM